MTSVFTLNTRAPGLYEITGQARQVVRAAAAREGLLTLYVQHTSCSLLIQENADPDVRRDLEVFFQRLVPPADHPSQSWITHRTEGPDDMPAHIKAALLATSLSIPILDGELGLGTWQGVYLFEHREAPQHRRVLAHVSP